LRYLHRIGTDENGLGARLGPLVVTAVLARIDEAGEKLLGAELPEALRADLDDSKALVSHANYALAEGWARVLGGADAASPNELLQRLTLETSLELRAPCPDHVAHQCWNVAGEGFGAPGELVERLSSHRADLARRGVDIVCVRSSIVCSRRLNEARERGIHRFLADLHAMERLVLALQKTAGGEVLAICGKVGGMNEYSKFFGPLAGWLHAIIEQGRDSSAYRFPRIGEFHFVRDADARDPLVMLASLVGKWVRELLMARVSHWYAADPSERPSGYHDPHTARFVEATALVRRERRVPDICFERARDPLDA
jgi:ribonuclease HII